MKRALPAVLCLLAVSCVPSKRRDVDSPTGLGSGEVLIIGRVRLTPPLGQEEQALSWLVSDWRGKIMVVVGDGPTPIPLPFRTSEYSGRIEAPADREFSVALPSRSFSIRGCVVPLDLSGGPADQALLPGGFRVDIRPDDVALYLGTIHYRRDEFWNITRVDVEDDYDRVLSECRKRWGDSVPLRKALVSASQVRLRER
jgi:hypothetical protein